MILKCKWESKFAWVKPKLGFRVILHVAGCDCYLIYDNAIKHHAASRSHANIHHSHIIIIFKLQPHPRARTQTFIFHLPNQYRVSYILLKPHIASKRKRGFWQVPAVRCIEEEEKKTKQLSAMAKKKKQQQQSPPVLFGYRQRPWLT